MTRVLLPAGPRYEALAPALEEAGFRPEVGPGPSPVPSPAGTDRILAAVVPREGLDPWRRLPPARRRRVILVAVTPDGPTGGGPASLALDANLVVAEADLPRLPQLLRAALADHLRLVRLLDPEAAP